MNVKDEDIEVLRVLVSPGFGSGTARRVSDAMDKPTYGAPRRSQAAVRARLRRLVAFGLVARAQSEGGHRAVKYSLTDSGRDLLEKT